ncbi:RB1-inducible coiled-coil protein 1 [Armadillidium vulgare]|nr:RB1-inducible coiled-coil protein 1 [Armadillidium vulgare]
MLYVFHVIECHMMTFEMNMALQRVRELKVVIKEKTGIPHDNQVLLISGGSSLPDDDFVCNYSFSSDTNPIFLFDTSSLHDEGSYRTSSLRLDAEEKKVNLIETSMKDRLEETLRLFPSRKAVCENTSLAKQIYELSNIQLKAAEDSVRSQHLQQQGWGCVVANLEECFLVLRRDAEKFFPNMESVLQLLEEKKHIINNFEKDLQLLRKIPLLPVLRIHSHKIGESLYSKLTEDTFKSQSSQSLEISNTTYVESYTEHFSDPNRLINLHEWMDIDKVLDIRNITRAKYEEVKKDFEKLIRENQSNTTVKEISGLGSRLCILNTDLEGVKKSIDEQRNLAESIQKNLISSNSAKDESIYPKLCETHAINLQIMLENLIRNVQKLYQTIFTQDKCIEYAKKHLKIITHIHIMPELYFMAISEVIRRQQFCRKYVEWTNLLSCEAKEIWEKETKVRKDFSFQHGSHLLLTLFPGLKRGDVPPFATEKPEPFDQNLPQFSKESLELLREMVPELSHLLTFEEPIAVPSIVEAGLRMNENVNTLTPSSYGKDAASAELFTSAVASSLKGSLTHHTLERTNIRESSQKEHSTSRPSSLVRDQPESETDTEEFEKVCGSISDGTYSPTECILETKSLKTKHSLPSQPSDSKHIKLDSSHVDVPLETCELLEPESIPHKKSTSSPECVISPSSQLSPEEFISPDFYIDESMPSSYSESTGTTTTTSSSVDAGGRNHRYHYPYHRYPHLQSHRISAAAGGQVRGHRVVSSELQKQIEEKDMTVAKLQNELESSRSQVETLQSRLNALSTLNYKSVLKDLRQEMENLKGKVMNDETSYINYISEVSSKILEVLEKIQRETEANQQLAVQSALTLAQMEEDERRNTLQAQLIDTRWINDERSQLIAENEDTVKKLTLEHEIEMENLRGKWQEEEKLKLNEIESLKEDIRKTTELLQKTQYEKENLQKAVEEKFEKIYKEKEENIRKILGATYMEHEKKSLEVQKQELEIDFNKEKLKLIEMHREELKYKLEEVKQSCEIESQKRLAKEQEEAEKLHIEDLQKCRDLWEAQKEEEVENKKEELKAQLKADYDQSLETTKLQYKMDLETLRSRFRMMTTANMDKSPSETSLEKFERGDFVETVYHDVMLTKLREELLAEKEKALDELTKNLEAKHSLSLELEKEKFENKRKEELRRMEIEKQEILKEISHDKERVIEDLRLRVEFLSDETEKLRKMNSKAQEEGLGIVAMLPNVEDLQKQCNVYKKEIERLEKEVQRAKRLSFISEKHPDLFTDETTQGAMSPGVSDIQSVETSIQKVQQENRELRNALHAFFHFRSAESFFYFVVGSSCTIIFEMYNIFLKSLWSFKNILFYLNINDTKI